jgi:hypothetical protein
MIRLGKAAPIYQASESVNAWLTIQDAEAIRAVALRVAKIFVPAEQRRLSLMSPGNSDEIVGRQKPESISAEYWDIDEDPQNRSYK